MPKIGRRGKDLWVRLPVKLVKELGIKIGDEFDVVVSKSGQGVDLIPKRSGSPLTEEQKAL